MFKKRKQLGLREGESLVVRASVCTGELTLKARNSRTGEEREIGYARNEVELKKLLRENDIDSYKREY
ncbi:MAG: hypothetical protein IJ831_01480 [Spirochaetales bacterium]|nr:hypothetical protein [Spirochaetales bacterium]